MTDADIRAWWRERGGEISARGPVTDDLRARYNAEHAGQSEPADLEPGDDEFGPDITIPGPPPADEVEAKPRTVATPRAGRFRLGRDKSGDKKKPKHKRVPVDDAIAVLWRGLAGIARPLPATSRLLKIQAPVAGIILEDTVRGTIVDRVLQPFARTSKNAEALAVLLGPPALVTAMQMNPQIVPFAMPALRELMLRMVKVAGPKMTEAMKIDKEFEEEFGGTVDDLIALLFEDLTVHEGETPEQAEEAAVRRVQEAMQEAAA